MLNLLGKIFFVTVVACFLLLGIDKGADAKHKKKEEAPSSVPTSVPEEATTTPADPTAPVATTEPTPTIPVEAPVASPATPTESTPAPSTTYEAVYVSGSASFAPKTELHISRTGDSYTLASGKKGGWVLPIKSIRGAIIYDKGVWFYWFDEGLNTLNCNLKMKPAQAAAFSTELAEAVKAANANPYASMEQQYKENFEAYQKVALEESK